MKKSGIYKIKSKLEENKFYIGSAVNIVNRFNIHKYTLKNNKHKNCIIQNYFNKHGNVLEYEIIEFCKKEDLIKREQYYIDILKPKWNIAKIAGNTLGVVCGEEKKEKLREIHGVKVFQYELNGSFIKEWNNLFEAASFYKVSKSAISKCVTGKNSTCSGYIWKSYKRKKINPKIRKKEKKVCFYDENFNLKHKFDSAKKAGDYFNIAPNFVSRTAALGYGKIKGFYVGYYFINIKDIKNNNTKYIYVFNSEKVLVGKYTSKNEILKEFSRLNLKINEISRNLNSRQGKKYKNLYFSYNAKIT